MLLRACVGVRVGEGMQEQPFGRAWPGISVLVPTAYPAICVSWTTQCSLQQGRFVIKRLLFATAIFFPFQSYAEAESFVLQSDVSVEKPGGFLGPAVTITASAGKYVAANTDEKGTYFNGPAYCWSASGKPNRSIAANCGIFVPKNASGPMRLYYYPDSVKRVEDGKTGSQIAREMLGPGGAFLVQMFDPDLAFEEKIEGFDAAAKASIGK